MNLESHASSCPVSIFIAGDHDRARETCRAFLRFRLGNMEMVRPHWRGDAGLGFVNPAYRVLAA